MILFAIAAALLAAGDPHVLPFPAATPTTASTPIIAVPAGSVTPATAPLPSPEAAMTPTAPVSRAALLGDDRGAATAAVEAVSLIGGADSLATIADYLARWSGDKEMERHGRSALTRLPIDASPLVRVLREDPDPKHRAWAAWTAGTHDLVGTGDALLKALKDPDAVVRARSVVALAMLGDARAQDPLMRIVVHDPDADTRQRASDALAMLAVPRTQSVSIEPALLKVASSDVFVRLDGVHEVEKARNRAAVGPLLKLLERERDVEVRRAAVSALATLGDEIAVPALIRMATQDSVEVRQFAIGALATLDDGRAIEPLIGLAKDPDPSIRRYTLRALAWFKRDGATAPVIEALSDPVPDVRSEAIKGITKIGDRSAADRVASRIELEPDSSIRQFECAALGNLGTIGNPSHERALVRALDDDEPLVRTAAAAALAKIGTKAGAEKALEKLVRAETKKKAGEKDPVLLRIAEDAAAQVRAR